LVKYRYLNVIDLRAAEYRHYLKERDNYRGQKYHPEDRYSKGGKGKDHGKIKGRGHGHGRGHD
jgi:hypothetical protein